MITTSLYLRTYSSNFVLNIQSIHFVQSMEAITLNICDPFPGWYSYKDVIAQCPTRAGVLFISL